MNDSNFDSFLSEVVSDESLAKKAPNVNPWETCMKLISCGLLISMFHLNFLGLNYILPPLGIIMVYCGVRALKTENEHLHIAWILSLIYAVFTITMTVVTATPLNEDFDSMFPLAGNIILTLMLIFLHLGFEKVFAKAETHQKNTPFLCAAAWEVFVIFAYLLGFGDLPFLFGLAFIAAIILIIRAMYKLKEILPTVGYEFLLSRPRISNKTTVILYLCACFVLTFSTIAYFDHTVNEAVDFNVDTSLLQRQELVAKGFPEKIINDITDEDIKLISGCESILYYDSGFNFDDKPTESDEEISRYSHEWLPLLKIHMQTEDAIYILEYFDLSKMKPRRNADFVNWFGGSDVYSPYLYPHSGKLLYEKDGKTKIADIVDFSNVYEEPYLGAIDEGRQELAGKICYPFGAENERGYILYEFAKNDRSGFMTCFNYCVNPYRINYPYSPKPIIGIGGGKWTRQDSVSIYGYKWEGNKILDYVNLDPEEYQ